MSTESKWHSQTICPLAQLRALCSGAHAQSPVDATRSNLFRFRVAIRRRAIVLDRPVDAAAHRFVHVRAARVVDNLLGGWLADLADLHEQLAAEEFERLVRERQRDRLLVALAGFDPVRGGHGAAVNAVKIVKNCGLDLGIGHGLVYDGLKRPRSRCALHLAELVQEVSLVAVDLELGTLGQHQKDYYDNDEGEDQGCVHLGCGLPGGVDVEADGGRSPVRRRDRQCDQCDLD